VLGPQATAAPSTRWGQQDWLLAALLAGVTLLVFSPIRRAAFIGFDDNEYIVDNPQVQAGLTLRGSGWAWTTTHAGNWHPLTWLSLMLDAQLFGTWPGGYHLGNLLLHLANTLLLFALLRRLTRAPGRSVVAAALFALHPLHVESVAWAAERKDVLSTFFGLLALWAYADYAARPSVGRYLQVAAALTLSLLAKPMLVTLPGLLLLLDYWPLGRWRLGGGTTSLGRLVLEKLPLLAVCVASSALTVWAQHQGGALRSFAEMPLDQRGANALVTYVFYLRQMLLPWDLTLFYPYAVPGLAATVGAGALLAAITGLALYWGRRYPYVPVGWLWYLGALVPVIGLVQVGLQARADRYTYVPLIGIFVLLSWGLADLAVRWRCRRVAVPLASVVLVCCALMTYVQVLYWCDEAHLWGHAVEVTQGNTMAHHKLGYTLLGRGDERGAVTQWRLSLQQDPDYYPANQALGIFLVRHGKLEEGTAHLQRALASEPRDAAARSDLAVALAGLGRHEESIAQFRQAVRTDPGQPDLWTNLGCALLSQGRLEAAAGCFREASRLDPQLPKPCFDLGRLHLARAEWRAAAECFGQAAALDSRNAEYRRQLGFALFKQGHSADAAAAYREALRLDPSWPAVFTRRAWALATAPDPRRRNGQQAVREVEQVVQATGGQDPQALDALAAALAEVGDFPRAVETARRARDQATAIGQPALARDVAQRLRLCYEKGQAFRTPQP
jgi:Flp pilus assembly protein TadD